MAKRNYRKHREQVAKNVNTIGLKRKMLDKKRWKSCQRRRKEVHQRMKAMTNRSGNEELEVMLSNKAQIKHFLDFLK